MKLLSLGILAFITLIGCQRTIQTGNITQTKNNIQTKVDTPINKITKVDTSINRVTKVDSTSKIESKLKVEDFTLSIKPKTFKNSTMGKAKLVITNNTNEQALADLEYYVDFYQDNKWKRLKLNENILFTMIAIILEPLSSREIDVNFKIVPYNYKPGRYRIIKKLITKKNKHLPISTGFRVE
ncbi:MAG TPA: immunoglobulin-like domain-containing protein [Flavobacterium sp.]|jgi:hypothetical protein